MDDGNFSSSKKKEKVWPMRNGGRFKRKKEDDAQND